MSKTIVKWGINQNMVTLKAWQLILIIFLSVFVAGTIAVFTMALAMVARLTNDDKIDQIVQTTLAGEDQNL